MLSSRLVYIVFLFFISGQCINNTWTRHTGSSGEDIWQSTSDFTPVQSRSFGAIKIGHEMSAQFDFVFKNRTRDPRPNYRENFFRIGYAAEFTANDCSGGKSSYPSLWLSDGTQDTGNLSIGVSSNGQCITKELSNYGPLVFNVTHHIDILINDSSYSIHISGGSKADYTETFTRAPIDSQIGDEVDVWWMSDQRAGSTDYNVGGGIFSNIILTSQYFPTTEPTPDPTVAPTQPSIHPTTSNPTTEPTIEPTAIPTANPTFYPTIVPTTEPTMVPTVNPTLSPVTSNPTVNPSQMPSIDPTDTPSQTLTTTNESIIVGETERTIEDTDSGDNEIITGLPNELFVLIIAGILTCLCCCFMLIAGVRWVKQGKEPNDADHEESKKSKTQSDETDASKPENTETETETKDRKAPAVDPEPKKQKIQKGNATPATPMGGIDDDGIDEYDDGGAYDHVEYDEIDGREWNQYEDEYYSDDTRTRTHTHGLGKIMMKHSIKKQRILSTPKDADPDIDINIDRDAKDVETEEEDTRTQVELAEMHHGGPIPVHAHPAANNSSVQFEEGYSWITLTLLQIAPQRGDVYLNNFKKYHFSEDRLFELTTHDLRKLIPDKMVRNEFQKLLTIWKMDQKY